ncbi:MAG: PQQ-binding-like beta-propeller repeat protein [Kofleriaceae bacterium]
MRLRGLPAAAALATALGACGRAPSSSVSPPATAAYVYPPRRPLWLGVAPTRRLGRGHAPRSLTPLGVVADPSAGASLPPGVVADPSAGASRPPGGVADPTPDASPPPGVVADPSPGLLPPLGAPTIWQLPEPVPPPSSAGATPALPHPALAAVMGSAPDGLAVELIDVDAGVLRWRVREPSGAIVGVTAAAIVGADHGAWALDLEGEPLWQTPSAFVAMAGGAVVVAGAADRVTVLRAEDGRELWRASLPAPHVADEVQWVCPEARALLLVDDRGRVHYLSESSGAGRVTWSAEVAAASAQGCADGVLAATEEQVDGSYALVALDPSSGRTLGRVDGVRAHWRADDGSIDIAADEELRRYSSRLSGSRRLAEGRLGRRLARWRGRSLVQAEHGLALIEPDGAVWPLDAQADSAALGAEAILTGLFSRTAAHHVARWAAPRRASSTSASAPRVGGAPVSRGSRDAARPPTVGAPVAEGARPPVAEAPLDGGEEPAPAPPASWRRDPRPALPPATLVGLDELPRSSRAPTSRPLALPAALEPPLVAGSALGPVIALRAAEGPLLARVDLAGEVRWRRSDGCAGTSLVGLAVADGLVLCAAHDGASTGAVIAADLRTGAPRWRRDILLDDLQLASSVILLRVADRAMVLRARDGRELAAFASPDGGPVRAALIHAGGAVLLVSAEAGALVARWPSAGLVPVWALAIDGAVTEVLAEGDHVHVVLAGGEVYSVRGVDGAVAAIAGEAERWLPSSPGLLGLSRIAGREAGTRVRVARYGRDGASRWARDLDLSGALDLLVAEDGAALRFGAAGERLLLLGSEGPEALVSLPVGAAGATWAPVVGAPGWVGVSADARHLWSL